MPASREESSATPVEAASSSNELPAAAPGTAVSDEAHENAPIEVSSAMEVTAADVTLASDTQSTVTTAPAVPAVLESNVAKRPRDIEGPSQRYCKSIMFCCKI